MEADGQEIAHVPCQAGVPNTAMEIILTSMAKAGMLTLSDEINRHHDR